MNILMLSSYLPYPLHSGGQVRLYNLIKELSSKHDITLICEIRPHQNDSDIAAVAKICKKVITVPRRKQWSIKNIVKSATTAHSFLFTGHLNQEMTQSILEATSKESFDLIHVETFYVMQNLPAFTKRIPIVLVEHNIEYKVYEKFRQQAPLLTRPLFAIDIAKIKKEEEYFWKKATRLVAVSEEDKKVMEQAGMKPLVVSNGVNLDEFRPKDIQKSFADSEKKLLFMGDFRWIQNKDSVEFIIKEIWPIIRGKGKGESANLKLWIVGRNIPESIKQLTNDPDIFFDEQSSEKTAPELFHDAYALLAPIRVGGGTSYKIIESMACGTPVITMPLSAMALQAKEGKHLLVGKTPDELAEKTVQLLTDKKLYEAISKKGREHIEEKYSWKEIGKELEKVYESAV
ncbi:MAG: glycosyltransferase family 4 protein [Patescibacteria group bacterium]